MSGGAWQDRDRDGLRAQPAPGSPDRGDPGRCLSAQESDSEEQRSSSSSTSSEGPAHAVGEDVPHVVPCKFIISLAIPGNVGHKGKYTSLIEKHRKRPKVDKPMAKFRRFYHMEYFLLPEDGEPKIVDMLVLPTVVKVFLESGVKTVRPWHEGDKLWVSWTQTFSINMTKELLKKINFHKITLRLWDTKDKVSRKVRYYRLKTAGYAEAAGPCEEVRHLVLNQRRWCEQGVHIPEEWDHEDASGKAEKAGKHLKSLHAEPETLCKNTEESEKLRMEDLASAGCNISRLPTISLGRATVREMNKIMEKPSFSSLTTILEKQKFQVKRKDSEGRKRGRRPRAEADADLRLTSRWKQGSSSVQLAVMPLLAGKQTVVTHSRGKSANILDCFLTLQTEVPIMTEEQKQDLNPLTIKIKCVSCLPSQPVPIHELERLCSPVYCSYRFHQTPVHQTEGRPHGDHIAFQDINVIFLGAMHPDDLWEYLQGPPMLVEVHDRDRKLEEHPRKPTLFGEEPLDSHRKLHTLVSPEETENNPFESQNRAWDPYGVAQVSLADLLLGHKYLNLAVPIHNCAPKPGQRGQNARRRKVAGLRAPVDGLHCGPMPTGNYLEANSLLKLRVDVAVPLWAGAGAPSRDPASTPFGRIIFVFDSREPLLLHSLLQDIATINAEALGLDSYPIENLQQMLSAFRVRVTIQDRQDLDVLTGFHLLDGKLHLLVLEGVADQGLRRLWDGHQRRMSQSGHGECKVLYNSQLLFQHRLYADLDAAVYHVHLFQPLAQLIKHTELYVHDAVPQEALRALTRIHSICRHSTRLREVIARGLLPSSATIKDLSHEFGLPVSELTDGEHVATPPLPTPSLRDFQGRKPTLASEVHAHQEKYLQWRNTVMLKVKGQEHSLVQKNITGARQLSQKTPKAAVKVMRISAPPKGAVYNYSMQTLNSAQLAKKELYREMAKEPWKRFTYSQNYLSATLGPQDPDEEEKDARKRGRQAWRTPSGFQVPGLHGGGGGRHLGLLPPGATAALPEEWRERALFANVLQPVLGRGPWSWDLRHRDFDLYRKPPPASPAPRPAAGTKTAGGGHGA